MTEGIHELRDDISIFHITVDGNPPSDVYVLIDRTTGILSTIGNGAALPAHDIERLCPGCMNACITFARVKGELFNGTEGDN